MESDEGPPSKRVERVLDMKQDWPLIPYLVLILIGSLCTLIDFIFLQMWIFQLNIFTVIGVILLPVAVIVRSLPRRSLAESGFGSIWNTPKLQIVEDHQLVTDGYYKHIRHPIYLGEIARDYCFPFIFSSVYAIIIMTVAILFLLKRIQIEEDLLLSEFGEEYEEYRSRTKKLIPYLY